MKHIGDYIAAMRPRIEALTEHAHQQRMERIREYDWAEEVECSHCGDTGHIPNSGELCEFCEMGRALVETQERARNQGIRVANAKIPSVYLEAHLRLAPNREAACQVNRWLMDGKARKGDDLVLTGTPGGGKSCLAAIALRDLVEQGSSGLWVGQRELSESLFGNVQSPIYKAAISIPVIVLDDLGGTYGTEYVRSKTAEVIEARWERTLVTIVTTNLATTEEVESFLGMRAFSRMLSQPVTHIVV